MTARLYDILGRARGFEGEPARFDHFEFSEGAAVPSSTVIEAPGWSLYCVDADRREGLFHVPVRCGVAFRLTGIGISLLIKCMTFRPHADKTRCPPAGTGRRSAPAPETARLHPPPPAALTAAGAWAHRFFQRRPVPDGRSGKAITMAKGQKRSNKEVKKPKQAKSKTPVAGASFASKLSAADERGKASKK
jgi:hypothetical protein